MWFSVLLLWILKCALSSKVNKHIYFQKKSREHIWEGGCISFIITGLGLYCIILSQTIKAIDTDIKKKLPFDYLKFHTCN